MQLCFRRQPESCSVLMATCSLLTPAQELCSTAFQGRATMCQLDLVGFGSSSWVTAGLIVEKWCCQEAVGAKYLPPQAWLAHFLLHQWVCIVQQFQESCWNQVGKFCLTSKSCWVGSADGCNSAGSQCTMAVQCCEEHILPQQHHKALARSSPSAVGSPCQCSSPFLQSHQEESLPCLALSILSFSEVS